MRPSLGFRVPAVRGYPARGELVTGLLPSLWWALPYVRGVVPGVAGNSQREGGGLIADTVFNVCRVWWLLAQAHAADSRTGQHTA